MKYNYNSVNRCFSFLILFIILFNFLASPQTLKLKIIETTDVHGAIFPFDFMKNKETFSSLAQVCTYVKQQREDKEQEVILLDNGDILQGQPVVYYYNFERTDTLHIQARVMNFMNYDAGTVGNHDIEAGHQVYDKFNKELNFPWLAANAVNINTGAPYFKPYTIIERKGFKIAVLGLITPYIPNWLPQKIWAGMRFDDMVKSAEKWVKIINEKEKPDLLIGLFHSGVEYNYGNQSIDDEFNENASQLVAEKIPGFDIVFVGHDHKKWNYKVVNSSGDSVLIMGSENAARNISVAEVFIEKDKETKTIHKIVGGQNISISLFKPEESFINKFNYVKEEVQKYFSKQAGVLTKKISIHDAMFGPSEFVNLIQKIQLDITGADISFSSPLSFEASLDSGNLFVRDLFTLYKYENLLYTMELTGLEIKNYLEYSFQNWFNVMQNEDDHLIAFKKDSFGKLIEENGSYVLMTNYYNFCSAAGLNYFVDVTKPAGEKVTITSMSDGTPFLLNKKYKVAINSYRGNGGGGHLTLGAKISPEKLSERIINSTERDIRYYLLKWVEKNWFVEPQFPTNWKIVPENYWLKGKEKDYKLLYRH